MYAINNMSFDLTKHGQNTLFIASLCAIADAEG